MFFGAALVAAAVGISQRSSRSNTSREQPRNVIQDTIESMNRVTTSVANSCTSRVANKAIFEVSGDNNVVSGKVDVLATMQGKLVCMFETDARHEFTNRINAKAEQLSKQLLENRTIFDDGDADGTASNIRDLSIKVGREYINAVKNSCFMDVNNVANLAIRGNNNRIDKNTKVKSETSFLKQCVAKDVNLMKAIDDLAVEAEQHLKIKSDGGDLFSSFFGQRNLLGTLLGENGNSNLMYIAIIVVVLAVMYVLLK
jgi:hypothetical protein